MGNSQLQLDWNLVRLSVHPSTSLEDSELARYTSPTSFRTFTVATVLDQSASLYEAKDDVSRPYHVNLYEIEDFEAVRELRNKLQFIRDNQERLKAAEIVEIIEAPNSDGSWTVAVVSEPSEFVSLEAWIDYYHTTSVSSRPPFALDDVIQGLLSVLEVVAFAHKEEQWLGQLLPHNVLISRQSKEGEYVYGVRLDLLHSQCFADFSESKTSVLFPPEGLHHTFKRDVWDLGISLLTAVTQGKVTEEVTPQFIRRSSLPASIQHFLLLMLREEDQRPSAQSLLQDPTLELLKLVLLDQPAELLTVRHIPALCLGLKLSTLSRKLVCLKMLLNLVAERPEAELGEEGLCADWNDLMSAIDLIDIVEEADYIEPLYTLALRMVKRKVDLAQMKESGFLRFVVSSLRLLQPEYKRELRFSEKLLDFAAKYGSSSCLVDIYDSSVFSTIRTEVSSDCFKAFFTETCYRLGLRAFTKIIEIGKGLNLPPAEILTLLKHIPAHCYKLDKCASPVSEYLTRFLRETSDKYRRSVQALVTEFLSTVTLSFTVSMSRAYYGKCLGDPQMLCEFGYHCRTCGLRVCQSCLTAHYDHEAVYCGKTGCEAGLTRPEPFPGLVDSLRPGAHGNKELLGPSRFEIPITPAELNEDKDSKELLEVYVEFRLLHGGDTDQFTVELATSEGAKVLSYSAQTGLIRAGREQWPGPVLSVDGVVGFGVTSRSRAFLTFNGLLHPAIVAETTLVGAKIKAELGTNARVHIDNARLLFKLRHADPNAAVSASCFDLVVKNDGKRPFTDPLWAAYQEITTVVAGRPSGQDPATAAMSQALLRCSQTNVDKKPSAKPCPHCSVF